MEKNKRSDCPQAGTLSGVDEQLLLIYDSMACRWNRSVPWVRDELIAWDWLLRKAREFASEGTILDCGCATGNFCRPLSKIGRKVFGIDFSMRMIDEARRNSKEFNNIEYIHADMLNLKHVIADGSVDLCLSIFGFCCLPALDDVRTFMHAMRAVMKPDGHALIQIPHPLDGFYPIKSSWIKDRRQLSSYFDSGVLVERSLKTITEEWLDVGRHHYTLSEYISSIVEADLKLIEVREPVPDVALLQRYPDLLPETRLPSSFIFVCEAD